MRTVNVRLVAILLGVLLVLGVGAYGLNKWQVRRNAGVFLREAASAKERAAEARKAKNRGRELEEVKAAISNYSKYLGLRPEDQDARREYGEYLAELGDFAGAISIFEPLLRQSGGQSDIRRKVVKMALAQSARSQFSIADPQLRSSETIRWFRTANNHLQDYLLKQSPDDGELWDLAGQCQAALGQQGQEDEAIASFEKAIELKPDQIETYGRLANFLRQRFLRTRAKEADAWIAKLLEANPDDVLAHLLAGRYYQENDDLEKAASEATRAMEIDPENRNALLMAAQCSQLKAARLFQKRQMDQAREELELARSLARRGITLHTEDVAFYLAAAQIEAGVGNTDEAVNLLHQGLRATGNDPMLLWNTAERLIQAGRIKEAKAIVDLLDKSPFTDARKGFMRGQLAFAESQWKEAIALFEKARSGLGLESQVLKQLDFLLGRAYAQLGNTDQAMRAYRRSLDNDQFFAPAQAAMVDLLLSQGKLDAATEIYRQLLGRQMAVSPRAATKLTLMKHAQGKASERDWLELDALLEEAAQADPNSSEIPLLRVESLLVRGQIEEADSMLTKCRDKSPDTKEYWNSLILLTQQRQEWEKADALIKDAQKKFGFTVELRLAVVRGAVLRHGEKGFVRLRQAAEKLDNFSEDEKISLLQGLLGIARQYNAMEEAKLFAGRLAELQPTNVQIRFQIFELAVREGNLNALERLLSDIEQIEGKGAYWHYCKAAWLGLSAKDSKSDPRLDEALKHLAQAAELRPSWSPVPMLAARILDQQQKPEEALGRYREAVKLGDRNPDGLRRLAQMLFNRQAFAESRAVLQLLGAESGGQEVERLATRLEAQGGNFNKALVLARKSAQDSENFSDHLWLGTLLDTGARRAAAEGKGMLAEDFRDEAEASLRRAVELSDKSPEAWLPLIRLLAANGKRDKAEEAVEEFRSKVDLKDSPLVLAQCYEALGDLARAKAHYDAAYAANPDNPSIVLAAAEFLYYRGGNPFEGEKIVRKVIDGKMKATDEEVCRARRMLAVILASRGGYANSQEALTLVDANLKQDASQILDQRIRASVLATLPSRAQREKAAEVFERLTKKTERGAVAPEDQFILAQLYLSQGDSGWTRFAAEMRDLLSTQGDQPKFLAFYIAALLKRGETASAETYMPRLEKAGPALFATANLKADLLFRKGEYEEALQILKGFIDKPNAEPADRGVRMRLVAESIEQLAARMDSDAAQAMRPTYVRAAEMIFRQYIDIHPAEELLLVSFFARLGLINEAIDSLERIVASENNPAAIAQTAVELMRSRATNDRQWERIESLLKEAISRFKQPAPLLILLADKYTEQSRFAEAESFYRDVLRAEENNAVAMNNLAVLLAQQKIQLPEALKLINRAIELAGPVAQMLDSRAMVYMAMGDPTKALKDLERAVADLEGPVQYFHQAQAYLLANRKDDAIASFETAKKKKLMRDNVQPLEKPVFDQLEALDQ